MRLASWPTQRLQCMYYAVSVPPRSRSNSRIERSSAAPPPTARRPARRAAVRPAAIGFDLPGDASNHRTVAKRAEELTRLASSLLLFQSVLRGKPAQAFLSVLAHLQQGSPTALLEHYGELFRLLAAEGHPSWRDYVVEQVLRGLDNPLSRAAARGEGTAHLLRAAAADLDALQQLAVADTTLASWVQDSTFGLPEQWYAAASSLSTPSASQHSGAGGQGAGFELPSQAPPALLAPLSKGQRGQARSILASKQRWGQAAEELALFYAAYGQGLLPNHRVLSWAGKLEGQDALQGVNALRQAEDEGLVAHEHHATKTLVAALSAFLSAPLDAASSSRAPPHAAVIGSPRDRWLHTTYVLERLPALVPPELAAAAGGLRNVLLPLSQLSSLSELAWSLHQHPRCRFVVLASGLDTSPVKNELVAILSGFGGFSWPANAVVLAGFEQQVPPELADTFVADYTASIEDIHYCA